MQVSIKNGGGIRAEIGEVVNNGDETLLRPTGQQMHRRNSIGVGAVTVAFRVQKQ